MYEHESGLPFAYDRVGNKQELQSVVFHGERPFIQGAELNDLQKIERNRTRRLARLVAKDGNRIVRADAVVDKETRTITLTSGEIYVAGDIFPVAEGVLTDVPMVGRVEIGVRLVKQFITHEEDPSLVGLVPGSLAEGEPGAAREVASIAWTMEGDGAEGEFYSVYTLQDGTILDQTGPSALDPVIQQLAIYDRPNGNYIVSGCRVTALGADNGMQLFSIQEGEANINGFKRTRLAALRHAEPQLWEEAAIPGETHIYPGGASHTFKVDFAPIGVINSILLTKEKTATVTRGAVAHGADGLSDTSVISVSEVKQGATVYAAGTSWNRVNNAIDWAPAGPEPAAGSSYQVTYRYREAVVPDSFNDLQITVSGGATGGEIIVAYTQKLPRIDRLGLKQDGSPIYIKGQPSRFNPMPPQVPADVLALCEVRNDWMNAPAVVNDGTRSLPYEEMWRYFNRVLDLDRLVQLERLKSGIDSREPVAKKGMFVDPLIDDTYRDQGAAQSGAVADGMLQLSITPTFYQAPLSEPVMLDWTEEVIVRQELKTACEKINPYANFNPLPGTMKLTPAADFWTVNRTDWTSPVTQEFNRGARTDPGPLQTVSAENQLVDQRTELLQFLRQISVGFTISGLGAGEILQTLTFDGINVKPAGVQTADGSGRVSGSFTIPEGVTAGSKVVKAVGASGTEATAMFTGQGTIAIDVMRRVTTVNNWTQQQLIQWGGGGGVDRGINGEGGSSDPQAQMFAVPELRQLVGVDFHVCVVGDQGNHLLLEQVTIDNGYPTSDVQAQAIVPMAGTVAGVWKQGRYSLPVTTPADRKHAFVIKTDDNEHSISLAGLGDFDAAAQKWVTSHPYVTGPRFSSVNAETWTAHQDEALTFRLIAAHYAVTTKVVDLGTYDLVDCSDLQVRAAVELPGAGCSVVFEIERTNGTIYRLLPFQVLQLTEYLTETVTMRAILTGTNKLSPVLFAPVQLVAGKIAQQLTYITRAFDLGSAVRVAAYYKSFLPGGATAQMHYSIDGGAWVSLPLAETEALAFPLWVERKHEKTNLTGTTARLRITATGGPAARLAIGDLGAGIF
ncbi:hypothetical protein ABID21_000656 [Pseudorhizobium tarimense]|uniref:DUF4815 domain-containing protein n=1 Tax=Pseudorhizobium tarimense TaxID=1079109 RepID=A0ABV2H213_9HYPH|nr:DUF4815 domain-containing protein [Pseudorhizobium tarimense]MCJ8517828.1 DUF4815 domain-containing protein [Pseudorhizobium tarimense]